MVFLFVCFNVLFLRITRKLTLIVSIISFGASTLSFLFAILIFYPIHAFISYVTNHNPSRIVAIIIISLLQFMVSTIPFRFRRLKKGMPFLYDYSSSDLGFYISITLLLAVSFFGTSDTAYLVFTIPVFFMVLCGVSILFWWRSNLTKRYIDKLNANEKEELQKIIEEKSNQVDELKYHNNELSKIIHKDNKLIPSLELAVREYLLSAENEEDHQLHITKAKELIEQLNRISHERSGILHTYEKNSKQLTSTTIQSIDHLFSYMMQKANSFDISFDLTLIGNISNLTDKMVNEEDLRTLLADLIENAIIATKAQIHKRILVQIQEEDTRYSINIYDSGSPFSVEVLKNLGIKRTTTHANDGGSGIGLMTTYELIREYEASLEIEEYREGDLFTKRVSIVFDYFNQYRIKSFRKVIIKTLSDRKEIILSN
jgi:Signal transduction histidine kinase regulating C4-dicarboxylate transport system